MTRGWQEPNPEFPMGAVVQCSLIPCLWWLQTPTTWQWGLNRYVYTHALIHRYALIHVRVMMQTCVGHMACGSSHGFMKRLSWFYNLYCESRKFQETKVKKKCTKTLCINHSSVAWIQDKTWMRWAIPHGFAGRFYIFLITTLTPSGLWEFQHTSDFNAPRW